jgi:ketosteroid isomerase-like protein
MTLRLNHLIPCALLFALAGCTQAPPPPPPDTRDADAKAIRDREEAAVKDMGAKDKDIDKITSFWADDASLFIPNLPVLNGSAAIKPAIKEMVSDPNFALTFGATKVEVSKAGDYAYSQGTYTQTSTDPKTKKAVVEKGKYVTVYKKQADGSWKAVADINNADAPAAAVKK